MMRWVQKKGLKEILKLVGVFFSCYILIYFEEKIYLFYFKIDFYLISLALFNRKT